MNTLARFATLFLVAALVPLAQAGSSASPELRDAAGDAPAAVDVTAGWFSKLPANPTTGVPEVDCNLFPCRDGFSITLKLSDLTAAVPATEKAQNLRYHYSISFLPSVWGETVTVECVISVADIGVANVRVFGPETGIGTDCSTPSTPAGAFDVQSATILTPYRHQSQDVCLSCTFVDRNADTLTVTLVEDLADIGPGTTFSGLQVKTYLSGISGPGQAYKTLADSTGTGASFTL